MRRFVLAATLAVVAMSACSTGDERTHNVRIDYRNDEFASHYWRFFPKEIAAHPGDTIVFRQQWTGEPHTVTLGTVVEQTVTAIAAVEEKYAAFGEALPLDVQSQAEAEFAAATKDLAFIDPYADTDQFQNLLQPCYLDEGAPPADPATRCTTEQQRQPSFNGRQSFYNSGFVPFEKRDANVFRVELTEDIKPGTYTFVCVLHMPQMSGTVDVKPASGALPTATDNARRTRREIDELSDPLREAFEAMNEDGVEYFGETLRPPLAGFHAGEDYTVAIDEFAPRTIRTRVGEPVKWTLVGAHTVSFNVPPYLPIFTIAGNGAVRRNPNSDRAAGGSPAAPAVDFTRHRLDIDGGTWNGTGFRSSGLLGSEPFSTYTLRFAKPGTYPYACLVHPPMIGKVVVSA